MKTGGIFVGLGANLPSKFGEPKDTLVKAKEAMEERGLKIMSTSRMYLTEPVPVSDNPWYHNEVVSIETALSTSELLQTLNIIEEQFGRVRTVKNVPRILDLDIIAYNEIMTNTESLVIPHPRMHERAFVLYPLRDISPNWTHPELDKTVDELIDVLPPNQEIKVLHE